MSIVAVDRGNMTFALSQHQEQTGHKVNYNTPLAKKIKVITKEPRDKQRKISEAIEIYLQKATLNRNNGHYLPDIYHPLLREEAARRGDH